MTSIKKKIFFIFLFSSFLIGSFNSINTGISFDEKHEQLNWDFHIELINEINESITSNNKFDKRVVSFKSQNLGLIIFIIK